MAIDLTKDGSSKRIILLEFQRKREILLREKQLEIALDKIQEGREPTRSGKIKLKSDMTAFMKRSRKNLKRLKEQNLLKWESTGGNRLNHHPLTLRSPYLRIGFKQPSCSTFPKIQRIINLSTACDILPWAFNRATVWGLRERVTRIAPFLFAAGRRLSRDFWLTAMRKIPFNRVVCMTRL